MYLRSINNVHNELKETELYKGKRPSIKPLFIDRCNYLLNSIIHINKMKYWEDLSKFEPIPLNSTQLQLILGRDYLSIVNTLQELDIIKINHSYLTTATLKATNINRKLKGLKNIKAEVTNKTYSLTPKALEKGLIKVGVLSPRMEGKINEYRKKKFKEYLKEPMHEQIINSTFQVEFNYINKEANEALNKYDINTDKGQYFTETYSELKEINSYTETSQYIEDSNFYYTQSKKVDRVYHYYTTIPKAYRQALRHKDGSQLAEIDLSNSQPLIMGLNYLNSKTTLTRSDKELRKDLLNANFYKRIAEHAKEKGDLEFYNLYENSYGELKRLILGEGLYFNYIPDFNKIKKAERYLLQCYPDFIHYLRNKKRLNGYKSVSQQAQQIEAKIFITGIFKDLKENDFALPVHDSLIVRKDEVKRYLNTLVENLINQFPTLTNAKELFKIKTYDNRY